MKRAIITVGLGFGDEGKGATVDYLTRTYAAELVVRYCGGSQAGHNVQLSDGRRHTFSQFGAGTLADTPRRPRTYLGPNVIIDPSALLREAEHLAELGVASPTALVTIHPHCLVTTLWHRTVNQLRELSRANSKHGSCGQGIGETRRYWLEHGDDAVFAADLHDRHILRQKLELLRQRMFLEIQGCLEGIAAERLQEFDLWELNTEAIAHELHEVSQQGITVSADIPEAETAIFEGAQGILLDEYRGFHPYTTWSTVTTQHAWELVEQMGVEAVAVLGLTRAYATRHGNGPLPTYNEALTARLPDPGNPRNPWQGGLRCGWLDMPLLRYAVAVAGPLDGLAVNHLDQLKDSEWLVCEAYKSGDLPPAPAPNLSWQSRLTQQLQQAEPVRSLATPDGIVRGLSELAPIVLAGFGPTCEDRHFTGLRFRTRRAPVQE